MLGKMIYSPSPRIIKALVGSSIIYAAWRFPIHVSTAAFLVLFPFPFSITYGSSNTLFVFLITAMWLARMVLRTAQPAGKTLLDVPVLFLVGAYLLSFNNVESAFALGQGLINFSTIVASIFVCYLIIHSIRTEATLRHMVRMITIMALLCFGVAIYELVFPGQPMIRGWILSTTYYDPEAIVRGLRVGGPFRDFELFAEFCAMLFPLMIFQAMRAEGLRNRVMWMGIVLLNFFVLMATVTRGATISMLVGMVYLLYRLRKAMTLRDFILTVGLSVSIWSGIEFYLSNYTVSGSVMDRLLNTKIVGGLPDSRTFWPQILERCREHIWIGHGPYYEFGEYGREKLRKFFWPHNGYLYYLHTVGLLGTSAFVYILGRLWWTTGRLSHASLRGEYAGSLLLVWHIIITIFAIDQMKIEYLRNQDYQFWPWIVFGLTVATINVVRNQQRGAGGNPETAENQPGASVRSGPGG